MRMLGTGIDAQIGHLLAAKTVAGDHPLHGLFDDAFGVGPVRLTVDGATRELVYYEPSAPDAADSGAAGAD